MLAEHRMVWEVGAHIGARLQVDAAACNDRAIFTSSAMEPIVIGGRWPIGLCEELDLVQSCGIIRIQLHLLGANLGVLVH